MAWSASTRPCVFLYCNRTLHYKAHVKRYAHIFAYHNIQFHPLAFDALGRAHKSTVGHIAHLFTKRDKRVDLTCWPTRKVLRIFSDGQYSSSSACALRPRGQKCHGFSLMNFQLMDRRATQPCACVFLHSAAAAKDAMIAPFVAASRFCHSVRYQDPYCCYGYLRVRAHLPSSSAPAAVELAPIGEDMRSALLKSWLRSLS